MDIFGKEIDDTTQVSARVKLDPHAIEIDFIRATDDARSHAVTTLQIDGVVDFQFLAKGQGARGTIMSWADGEDATGFVKHREFWLKSLDFSFLGFHVRDRGIPIRRFSLHTTGMLLSAHYFGPAGWSITSAQDPQ